MRYLHRLHPRTLLAVLAGLLLAGWLVPPFFHGGRYRRILQTGLENKLGRPVKLGAITLRLLPHPGFSIDNVVVEEDPQFGSEPLARVSRAECDLRWRDLWKSRVNCARIFLDHPSLNVVRNAQGKWNIENFLEQRGIHSGSRAVSNQRLAKEEFGFEARDASVNFTVNGTKKPFVLNAGFVGLAFDPAAGLVHLHVTGSLERTDLSLPSPGSIDLTGEWKPGRDLGGPFHLTVSTHDSLLYGWIPLVTGRNPEVFGLVNATLRVEGSIHRAHLSGSMRISQLHRWASIPPVSPMPVDVRFAASWDASETRLSIHQLDTSFAGSRLHMTGIVSQVTNSPYLDLVLAIQDSRLENFLSLGTRLTGHTSPLGAWGRVVGLVTVRGPFKMRQYGGFLAIHSLRIRVRAADFFAPDVGLRIDPGSVSLSPTRFYASPHVECVAQGFLTPPFPDSTVAGNHPDTSPLRNPSPADRYSLTLSTKDAKLPELVRIARNLGVARLQNLDTQGLGSSSVVLTGAAWPFRKPQFNAKVNVQTARLLIPGLTEPVMLRRFHLEIGNGDLFVDPVMAQIGPSAFSGWLRHEGPRGNPWTFGLATPQLSLEQASLWFAALGHQRPLPVLDLIPGLRSLAARRLAGRSIFASINAQGQFRSREITFRSLRLRDFQALISLAGRVAHVSHATFKVAGGSGRGEAEVNFKQVPAHVAGGFRVTNLKLHHVVGWLPAALDGLSGSASATGRFTTRGLTRQEMSVNLRGVTDVSFKNIQFGRFDPLQAAAKAASLGSFLPSWTPQKVSSASLTLTIANQQITLQGSHWPLSGSTFSLAGNYGFDGVANLYVHANLGHASRRWKNDGVQTQDRAATLHFVGHLKNLTLVRGLETARFTGRSQSAEHTEIPPIPPVP